MSGTREGLVPNPVLAGLIGVCPLIAAAKSLAEGVVYGLGAALCAIALAAIVPLLKNVIADRLKAPASLALSAMLALSYGACVRIYSPTIAAGLWIYVPLLAVSGLSLSVLRRSSSYDHSSPERGSRFGVMAFESLLFFLTAAFVGGMREIIGLGTLTLPTPGLKLVCITITDFAPMRIFVSPAGGFIFLGFSAAIYRAILRIDGRKST